VRCGIESVDPIPTETEVEAFYQEIFYQHYSRALPERWQWRLRLVERAFKQYIDRWFRATGKRKPQRFLDTGGGLGHYAKAAINQGIESCLMDYSDEALQFGRNTLGISWTVQGDIQKCAQYLEKESFDLVLAKHWHWSFAGMGWLKSRHQCGIKRTILPSHGNCAQFSNDTSVEPVHASRCCPSPRDH